MPNLRCHRVIIYSPADETGFFAALRSIEGIRRMTGKGENIILTVSSRLSESSLRDLIGVFHRYKINMRQLAAFKTTQNASWFHDPEAYWFKKVFGRSSSESTIE
jgi:hypothetical protein